MTDIFEIARGRWPQILATLGVPQQFLTKKHGPCPICGGTDRYRFDDKDGKGTYYCSQCVPHKGDGIDILIHLNGWSIKKALSEVKKAVGQMPQGNAVPRQVDPRKRLNDIRKALKHVTQGDPVWMYLRKRGLSLTPQAIRYHEFMPYYEEGKKIGCFPSMVAKIEDKKGKPVSYHVTYLTKDGDKADVGAPKKILRPVGSISGCFIKLTNIEDHIAVAEGIETAIAHMEWTGIPTWAAVSANLLEKVDIPEAVKEVTIVGDADESYTGQKAAFTLANKLWLAKKVCKVIIPQQLGTDFLEMINEIKAQEERKYA